MNIELKSKSLSNYYSTKPDNYTLTFHHYNVIVDNKSNNEYMLLEQDIELIRNLNKENSIIYFSDIENLIKVMNNTNIFNRLNDIYLRIRNVEEYRNFNKLNININIVIEKKDLEIIKPTNDRIVLQIDDINELPIKDLDELREKYNITHILLGQIQYITNDYAFLLNVLSEQFGIDKSYQLELEKNNEITNDIYNIETYKKIIYSINKIIETNKKESILDTIYAIFMFIASNISYDEEKFENTKIENQNLIGPLFHHKAVCEGYSKLFKQVLSLLEIESIIVSGGGTKEDGGHVWNQVKIENKWYNADVTAQNYSICNNENRNMFLVSDKKCKYKSLSPFAKDCRNDYYN